MAFSFKNGSRQQLSRSQSLPLLSSTPTHPTSSVSLPSDACNTTNGFTSQCTMQHHRHSSTKYKLRSSPLDHNDLKSPKSPKLVSESTASSALSSLANITSSSYESSSNHTVTSSNQTQLQTIGNPLPTVKSSTSLNSSIEAARSIVEYEFKRMGFDEDDRWRITEINQDFELCNTYPRFIILPASVKDEDLESIAKFRYFRRIPNAVWRHKKNGCFIVRSSQPTVGWWLGGWRNEQDESLLQAFVDNTTSCDQSEKKPTDSTPLDDSTNNLTSDISALSSSSKLLIIDARSYTAAVANRAKGGGCECSEYYQKCEVQFMNLANIHSIRKSFHAIRSVCETYSEQSNNWLSLLDNSKWLHHISGLLKSALLVVDVIDSGEKSTLIHCSDGWDRTPQIVALAEIMLDSFYRTFDGFRILVQREWLDFGHKFADRCGNGSSCDDPNERCPVFLQWLDCVQQLIIQYPSQFEFNSQYLVKLINHTYSCVFGTFLCNSAQERALNRIDEQTFSVWSYFDSSRSRYINEKYQKDDEVLRPSCKVRDLHFWKEVYLPSHRASTTESTPNGSIGNNSSTSIFDMDGSLVGLNPAAVQAKMSLLVQKVSMTNIKSLQQDSLGSLKTLLRI